MDVQEIVALNDLRKALLSVNGAIGRLGRDKDEMIVVLPNDDWVYFNNVLESGNAGLSKFYIPVDDDSFKLSGITISRSKVEEK